LKPPTFDLFKSFAVELAHAVVLFAQEGNTPVEGVGNAQIITVKLVLAIGPFIAQ
jgi:hypothetical protein